MATLASQSATGPNSSRSSSVMNGNAASDFINGHGSLPDSSTSITAPANPSIAPPSKKGKGKKTVDPNETGKLLAAKINQLELDAAGEKDQELEIEREVRKATRDLNNLLAGMGTPMERVDALQKKNTDLLSEMKRLERDYVKNKKRADQLAKDKDVQRAELGKSVTMKDKLEKLCRELTRENKKMKEENKKLEDAEKKSREQLSERAEQLLWDIEDIMEQKENPETQKLTLETDELFRQKFKSFLDQWELRELHFHSLTRMKECELQHNMARYEHQRKVAETETARSRQLSIQVSTFSHTETELRSQLNIYVEKFKQVEDTLNNSNDLFLTFRKEMEEMSKKTKRLEKENLNLTRKHDLTNRNILEMAEERTRVNKEVETLRKKNNTLESVIRRMQDQGRGQAVENHLEGDEEGTESDYEEEDYDEEDGSEEGEYDDDTEEEVALQATANGLPAFGPIPPPPAGSQPLTNGKVNGEVNGVKH